MHLKNLLRLKIILIFFSFPLFVNNLFASERYTIANSKALKLVINLMDEFIMRSDVNKNKIYDHL